MLVHALEFPAEVPSLALEQTPHRGVGFVGRGEDSFTGRGRHGFIEQASSDSPSTFLGSHAEQFDEVTTEEALRAHHGVGEEASAFFEDQYLTREHPRAQQCSARVTDRRTLINVQHRW